MPDTTDNTAILNPEAPDLLDQLRQLTSQLVVLESQIELCADRLSAKGLAPNEDGTAPIGLAVDDSGYIGGKGVTTLLFADYAHLWAALGTIQKASDPVRPDVLRFAKGR